MDNINLNDPKGRLVINCTHAQANSFFSRLKKIKEITLKSYKKATDTVFQERYFFTADIESISVVYETRSNTLIITASDHILSLLKDEFEAAQKPSSSDNIQKNDANKPIFDNQKNAKKPLSDDTQKIAATDSKKTLKQQSLTTKPELKQQLSKPQLAVTSDVKFQHLSIQSLQQSVKPTATNLQQTAKSASVVNLQSNVKQRPLKNTQNQKSEQMQNSINKGGNKSEKSIDIDSSNGNNGGGSEREEVLRSVSRFKLESMLSIINSKRNAEYATDKNSFREGCEIYAVSSGKAKVAVKYYPDKFLAQLNGKNSRFFDEILGMLDVAPKALADDGKLKEDSKLKIVHKKLKKMMPHAFDILSEQSRDDFCIGMTDISNDKVRLSDYSMLLVPPYRGLECLISDLQKAKNIDVKMIGQAYEKLDGKYVLKSGYRKSVNSHVYCEVMSALYIEYFEKRNFYAHSDITGDSLSRVISDKDTVKEIFNSLIELIEYNIFKLHEIRFWKE